MAKVATRASAPTRKKPRTFRPVHSAVVDIIPDELHGDQVRTCTINGVRYMCCMDIKRILEWPVSSPLVPKSMQRLLLKVRPINCVLPTKDGTDAKIRNQPMQYCSMEVVRAAVDSSFKDGRRPRFDAPVVSPRGCETIRRICDAMQPRAVANHLSSLAGIATNTSFVHATEAPVAPAAPPPSSSSSSSSSSSVAAAAATEPGVSVIPREIRRPFSFTVPAPKPPPPPSPAAELRVSPALFRALSNAPPNSVVDLPHSLYDTAAGVMANASHSRPHLRPYFYLRVVQSPNGKRSYPLALSYIDARGTRNTLRSAAAVAAAEAVNAPVAAAAAAVCASDAYNSPKKRARIAVT